MSYRPPSPLSPPFAFRPQEGDIAYFEKRCSTVDTST